MSFYILLGGTSRMRRIDNYRHYWSEIVTLDYLDFIKHDDDLRRAFHCATTLFHMHEWLYAAEEVTIRSRFRFNDKEGKSQPVGDAKAFANSIADTYPDFELIRGIANSAKHFELKPRRNATPPRHPAMPSHAANTYFSLSTSALGPFFRTGEIMLQMPGGVDRSVVDLAISVWKFWPLFCSNNGWPLT
jgi:hypothetical protein